MISRTSSIGNGGTSACSFSSSCSHSLGSVSARLEAIWPNLTYVGPSSCSSRRAFTGGSIGSIGPFVE